MSKPSSQKASDADWHDLSEQKTVAVARGKRVSASARASGRPRNRIGRPVRPPRSWRSYTVGDAADAGMKAWQLAKHLATLINVEEKTWDVDGSAGTTVTSTATVVNLSNIAQGDDYGNRTGDSILCQSIEFRATVSGNTATPRNKIRVLIVRDKANRGVDPVIGDVLQGGTSPSVQPYLEPQSGRFDVLYDQLVFLNNTTGLAASGTSTDYVADQEILPSMIKKWNQHIKYAGTAGADGSNWAGALFLMAISSDAANGPNLLYTFRIRFTDN
jgi:hypothetical protein